MFKYTIAITIIVFFGLYAWENSQALPKKASFSFSAPPDSGRKKVDSSDVPTEESSTPIKMTYGEFDSLVKPIGVWVGNLDTSGIEPWEQIRWEAIDSITKSGYWLMLDSHFVFKDYRCFKWYGKLGVTPDVPDTIWIEDTCAVDCRYERTIPLGCYITTYDTVSIFDTVVVCDTICVQTLKVSNRFHYYLWDDLAFQTLRLFTSCNLPAQSSTDFLFVKYNNVWYQPLNDGYRPFGAADDSCYIDMYQWTYFVYMTTQPFGYWTGLGPWEVDSTTLVEITQEVSCELYGHPGITKEVTNCRNEEKEFTAIIENKTWTDAGRDTTIVDDSCDCFIPVFVCTNITDDIRHVKYIYDYEYDTIKDICLQSYLIPQVEPKSDFKDVSFCLYDPEYLISSPAITYTQWINFKSDLAALGSKTPDPTKIHMEALMFGTWVVGYCWSCIPDNDPPLTSEDYWISEADLASIVPDADYRCKWRTTCEVVEVNRDAWETYTNWCCSKDTTVYFPCEDEYGSIGTIFASYTYSVPDMDVLCRDSIITDVVKTDSTLRDSIVWWTPGIDSTIYVLTWEDTCCYNPTFNGQPWGCDFWLINDCGPQLYPDALGRWHIPCPTAETAEERDPDLNDDGWYEYMDYNYVKNVVQEINRREDSIRQVLEDSLTNIRLDLDSLHVRDTISNGFWSWEEIWTKSTTGSYEIIFYNDSNVVKLTPDSTRLDNPLVLGNSLVMEEIDDPEYTPGTIYYSDGHFKTFLAPADVIHDIGQEIYMEGWNRSGVTIPNGTAVTIDTGIGHTPTLKLAKATSTDSSCLIGVATHDIPDNTKGLITTFGSVKHLNTSSYLWRTKLYLSPDTAGGLTPILPNTYDGEKIIVVAHVIEQHATQGSIHVNIRTPPDYDRMQAETDTLRKHTREIDSLMQSVDTLYRWNDAVQSAGRVWGGLITPNGDGTVSVKAGLGWIKAVGAEISTLPLDCGDCDTDSSSAMISKILEVPWDSVASLALTDSAYNLIYFDGSDSTIKATTDFYSISFYRDFTLGRAYRMGTEVIARLCGTNVWSFDRRVQQAGEEIFPVIRAKGLNVSEGSFRTLNVTSGIIWAELVNRFTTQASNTATDSLTYWYRSGTGWASYKTVAIDSMRYDDGSGTLATLTVNRYGDNWVYIVHDGSVHIVYGRGDYTLTNAQAATPPHTLPGLISSYATLRAKIIIQRGSGTFYSIESPDDVRFTTIGVTDHADLSGLQGGTSGEYYHLTTALYNKIGVDSTKIFAGANISLSGNPISGYTISATGTSGGTGLQALQGLAKQSIMLKDTLGRLEFTPLTYDSSIQISIHPDTAVKYETDTSATAFWSLRTYWPIAIDTSKSQGILGFDTTKLLGLPEEDPIWIADKPSYVTFSSLFSTQDSLAVAYDSLAAHTDSLLSYADSLRFIRVDLDSLHVKDTIANGFYNWAQAGVVIVDTSILQGIIGYDTSKAQGIVDLVRAYRDTSGLGFWNFSETDPVWTGDSLRYAEKSWVAAQGYINEEDDPVWGSEKSGYIRFLDSTSFSKGYVTPTSLQNSLASYLAKADSSSYSGYITPKALSDTLDNNPRGGGGSSVYSIQTTTEGAPDLDPDTYDVFFLDASERNVAAALGNGTTTGQEVFVKCVDATNTCTLSSVSSIDGDGGSKALSLYDSYHLVWTGTTWYVLAKNP